MKLHNLNIDTTVMGWVKSATYFIAMCVTAAINYIETDHVLIYTLTFLMVLDWITGVIKAKQLNVKVTSKRSNKGIIEKLMLLVIPVAIAVTLKAVNVPIGVTMRAAFSLLTVAELFSVISNAYCIYTRTDIQEYDAVSAVIKFMRASIMKALKGFLEDNNKGDKQP